MTYRRALSIAGGLVMLLAAERAAAQAAPLQYEYHASWIALASPEPIGADVESKSWARLLTFRPERAFVLTAPLAESGKSKARLEAGVVMVGMKDGPGIACRLERPTHVYFIECVEDSDLDEYVGAFRRVAARENEFDSIYPGHGRYPLDKSPAPWSAWT